MTVRALFQKIRSRHPDEAKRTPFLSDRCKVRHSDGSMIKFGDLHVEELRFIPKLAEQMHLQHHIGVKSLRYLGEMLHKYTGNDFGITPPPKHTHLPQRGTISFSEIGAVRGVCECGKTVVSYGWRVKEIQPGEVDR